MVPHSRYRAVEKKKQTNESIKFKELLLLPSAAVSDISLILKDRYPGDTVSLHILKLF